MARQRRKRTRIEQAYTAAKRTGNLPGRGRLSQAKAAARKLMAPTPRRRGRA